MAVKTIDNISPEKLRWAFQRAGYQEEQAKLAFPRLTDWLSEEKKPTMKQLQDFAKKFHVPLGYLFLQSPPVESIPFPMFRSSTMQKDYFDLNVYDTVMSICSRQEWLEDYLQENEMDVSPLVGIVTLKTGIGECVQKIRSLLRLEPRWAFGLNSPDVAVSVLTERLEENGVFVAYNGVVGNNTRRTLDVNACRGFALVNKIAPYIFVNNADSKTAQLFTLIHETVHLMLGVSAGHAGEEIFTDEAYESYCDKVAAEFLVPATEITKTWNGKITEIAKMFKVSEIVIARRAYNLGLLDASDYRDFWMEYKNRPKQERKTSGGNFYHTSVKRVGRLFAIHVRNAVNNRQLNYTDAYRLTGLYGSTYNKFMATNI